MIPVTSARRKGVRSRLAVEGRPDDAFSCVVGACGLAGGQHAVSLRGVREASPPTKRELLRSELAPFSTRTKPQDLRRKLKDMGA